jgi:HAE1 family hydrophobic/amphiphilic exporter-1
LAQITIQFDLGAISMARALDVQTARDLGAPAADRNDDISVIPQGPGDFPVLYVSLRSDTVPLSTVDDYAETVLAPQLSQLPGVARVLVYARRNSRFAFRSIRSRRPPAISRLKMCAVSLPKPIRARPSAS